jgi:hypothetical protein
MGGSAHTHERGPISFFFKSPMAIAIKYGDTGTFCSQKYVILALFSDTYTSYKR